MHGQIETSRFTRYFTVVIHAIIVIVVGSYLMSVQQDNFTRRALLFICALVYWIRASFGMLVLLKRRFDRVEVIIVLSLFALTHGLFAYLGAHQTTALGLLDGLGLITYVIGSYLNTSSEYRRHIWKKDPLNKGKLYTSGLFQYSIHINYLGDSLLFTGYALISHNYWSLCIPLIMTTFFIFQHIPTLDTYLAERYKDDFAAYAKSTKKFIPYIY